MIFIPVKFCWILFSGFREVDKNKMAAPASDKLRHFRLLPWNRWMEFNDTWREATSQRPLPSFFFDRSEKQDDPWPLIGWDIFDISPETAERNSTKLDGTLDRNVLYQVCVFRIDRKNKMAILVSNLLRHFRLLLWNYWTECNKTWQEARSQRSLPSLYFFRADQKNQMAPLASDFLRHFRLLLWKCWAEFSKLW